MQDATNQPSQASGRPWTRYHQIQTNAIRSTHLFGLACEVADLLVKLAHDFMHNLAPLVQGLLCTLLALDNLRGELLDLALETLDNTSLVTSLSDDFGVVGDSTTVPGKDLALVS